MADTGAPWNLPYPLPTDLVRDGAEAIEDLAEAVADGLDAAGGLVAVKHVLKTDTFTASSVGSGANVAVTGLEITHEVAEVGNRLIITAYFGAAGNGNDLGQTAIAVAEDGTLIGIGNADGARTRVGAGGLITTSGGDRVVSMPSVTFVHTPAAGPKVYTVRAFNTHTSAADVFVNRSRSAANDAANTRAVSALIIQEIKV